MDAAMVRTVHSEALRPLSSFDEDQALAEEGELRARRAGLEAVKNGVEERRTRPMSRGYTPELRDARVESGSRTTLTRTCLSNSLLAVFAGRAISACTALCTIAVSSQLRMKYLCAMDLLRSHFCSTPL
jgi:hypothetical protein